TQVKSLNVILSVRAQRYHYVMTVSLCVCVCVCVCLCGVCVCVCVCLYLHGGLFLVPTVALGQVVQALQRGEKASLVPGLAGERSAPSPQGSFTKSTYLS